MQTRLHSPASKAQAGGTLILVGLSRRLSGETGSKRRRCARRNIPSAAIDRFKREFARAGFTAVEDDGVGLIGSGARVAGLV